MFDKLVNRLVLGGAYTKHADQQVSATTLRQRMDEWITARVFSGLEQIVLQAFDWLIGLDLEHLTVDGCCVKAPCGGDNTGPNPIDQGKSGQKRSVLCEGHGLPIGVVLAGANRHDSPLLEPTLDCLERFELADLRKAKAGPNYHIQVDKNFYSVPSALIGQSLDVRLTSRVVEVFNGGQRVASHARFKGVRGRYATVVEHMPAGHRHRLADWSPARFE